MDGWILSYRVNGMNGYKVVRFCLIPLFLTYGIMQQLSFVFDEIIPIPECSGLMEMTKFKRPIDLADEMVREAKLWQQKHPDRDIMDIITPEWKEYIKSRLQ